MRGSVPYLISKRRAIVLSLFIYVESGSVKGYVVKTWILHFEKTRRPIVIIVA